MTDDLIEEQKWRGAVEFLQSASSSEVVEAAFSHLYGSRAASKEADATFSINQLLDDDFVGTSMKKLSRQAAAALHIGPAQTQVLLLQYLWVCSSDVGGVAMHVCCRNPQCPCMRASVNRRDNESLASLLEPSLPRINDQERCRMVESLKLFDILTRCYDTETGGFLPSPKGSAHQLADLIPTAPMTHIALHILNTLRLTPLATDGTLPVWRENALTNDSSNDCISFNMLIQKPNSSPSFTITNNKWLDVRKTLSFVLRCQKKSDKMRSSSQVSINSSRSGREPLSWAAASVATFDERMVGGFAASPSVKEIDLRHTFSALMALTLLVAPMTLAEATALPERNSHGCTVQKSELRAGHVGSPFGSKEEELRLLAKAVDDAASFIARCWNAQEGGFGGVFGEEAHGGMTYCAIASLALTGHLQNPKQHSFIRTVVPRVLQWCLRRLSATPDSIVDSILNRNTAHAYLFGDSELDIRGFQGRMHKDSDSCYTYWVGCTLDILSKLDWLRPRASARNGLSTWLDTQPLIRFLSTCKDNHAFAKNPHCCADSAHACFGLCGASLLLQRSTKPNQIAANSDSGLRRIHPVYGCSTYTAAETNLPNLFP